MSGARLRSRYDSILAYVSPLFYSFLILYLALLLLNQFRPVIFATYLNYLLVLVVMLGVVTVWHGMEEEAASPAGTMDYVLLGILGLAAGVFVYWKASVIGWLAYALGTASGLLVISLGMLFFHPDALPTEHLRPRLGNTGIIAVFIAVAALHAVLGVIFGFSQVSRVLLLGVTLLVAPGALLSYLLFPSGISVLERAALSFLLSVVAVSLLTLSLSLLGLRIGLFGTLVAVVILCSILLVGLRFQTVYGGREI